MWFFHVQLSGKNDVFFQVLTMESSSSKSSMYACEQTPFSSWAASTHLFQQCEASISGINGGLLLSGVLWTLAEWRTSPPPLTTLKSDTGNEVNFSGNRLAAQAPSHQRARWFMHKIHVHMHVHPTTSQDERVAKRFLLVIFASCTTDPAVKLPPSRHAFTVKNESGDILMKWTQTIKKRRLTIIIRWLYSVITGRGCQLPRSHNCQQSGLDDFPAWSTTTIQMFAAKRNGVFWGDGRFEDPKKSFKRQT